jgi:hypothetical protein
MINELKESAVFILWYLGSSNYYVETHDTFSPQYAESVWVVKGLVKNCHTNCEGGSVKTSANGWNLGGR